MLFDTHLHLIYPNRLRYPWLNDVPALNKPYQYEDYERDAARFGIIGSMHMEVDVAPAYWNPETRIREKRIFKSRSLLPHDLWQRVKIK